MELRHLRYFVVVAEEQNISRAAERLFLSQPPLSRQIRDLEQELGVDLLVREANSVRLSEAGKLFYEHAVAILERANQALHAMRSMAKVQATQLRIGYAPSLSVEILPAALREFSQHFAAVKPQLSDLSTAEMLRALREGSIDLALMLRPDKQHMDAMIWYELKRYEACVAVCSSHAFAAQAQVSLACVLEQNLQVYSAAHYPDYQRWLQRLAADQPLQLEQHDSLHSLLAAVEAGRGVALLPGCIEVISGSRLVLRRLANAPAPFVVGVVLPAKALPEALAFASACRAVR